jgi:thymidylate synthase
MIRAFDCPDAWYQTLREIWVKGEEFTVGYGSECTFTKKLSVSVEITNPEIRPLIHEKAPCDMDYINLYALRYLWSNEKDDETYTYGSRLREPINQLEEAVKRYIETVNDRQVTLVIRQPVDILKTLDSRKHEPPCLTMIDTEILGNALHLTCYFRSWDAYAGMPANIAGLQILNEALVSEINQRGKMNIRSGKLIFHSKNCHIYERQFELAKELFGVMNKKNRPFDSFKKMEEGESQE